MSAPRRVVVLVIALLFAFVTNGLTTAYADSESPTPSPASLPTTIGECLESGQVWLYVTYDQTVMSNQCVGNPRSGMEALAEGGLTIRKARGGYVCSLDSVPKGCPSTSYWTYFHSLPETAWSTYEYSDLGASSFTPPAGSIEAWCYSHDSTTEDVHCDPQPLRITKLDGTVINPDGVNPAVTTRPAVALPSSSPLATIGVLAGVLVLAVAGLLWTRRNRRHDQQF